MSENASRSATARQNGIAELARRALSAPDLATLLVEAAGLLADATGGDVTVLESQPDGSLRIRATAGDVADGDHPETGLDVPAETVRESALGRALDAGESLVADEPTAGPFEPYGDGIYAPTTDDEGRHWGIVTVHSAEPAAFDDETRLFVENAASVLGTAFSRLRQEPVDTGGETENEDAIEEPEGVHEAARWVAADEQAALDEVLGRVTDAFFALDSDWQFTYVNDRAEELLDSDAAHLIGRNLWEEFPETVGSTFEERYRHALETGEAVAFEEFYQPLSTWFAVRAYPSETGLSVYFRDVTDRRKREQELAGLHDVNQQFPHAETPEAIADLLVEATTDVLALPGATVYLHDESEEKLRPVAAAGTLDEPYQELPTVDATEPESLVSRAFIEGETRRQQDVAPLASPMYSGAHLRQGLFVPLDDHGVLVVGDVEAGAFADRTVELAEVLAGNAASELDRIERETALRERERELQQYETMVETVADGVFVVGPDDRFATVNDAFADMTGYDREELVGAENTLVLDEGSGEAVAELDAGAQRGEREPVTVETTLETADGGQVPVEARVAPLPMEDDYGRAVVVRDVTDRKQFEETLTALHESSRELLKATNREEVAEVAVETAVDVLGLDATAVYLFDEHSLRPAAYTDYVAELFGDPPPSFSSGDEKITWRTFLEGETVQHDDVREDEYVEDTGSPLNSGLWIPLGDHGVFATLSEEYGAFDEDRERLADLLATTMETALDRLEREEMLRKREQDLEERNERLTRLDQINGIIRDIDQALVGASTREEIETAVCERLTDQEGLDFVWIGEADSTTGEVVARTWAGKQRGYLDAIDLDVDTDEPTAVTERTREATVVDNIADKLRSEPWRKKALARDFQSVVSVPIGTDEIGYGSLTIYSGERAEITAFADVFRELGETIGNAIDAAEAKRTMHSDTGVSIELRVDDDDPFSLLARQVGCTVEFEGLITQEASEPRVCVTTKGAPASEIIEIAESLVSIDDVVLLSKKEEGEEALFEVSTGEPSLATTVAEIGATPKTIRTDGDGSDMTVVLSEAVPVREFVERLRSQYPSAELLARQDKDDPQQTPRLFRANVEEELTDRQQEVLQTAYLSGYFEWPRDSTGEELADALGISQPTVNRHLRTAERKVYTLLFEA